ncbi:alpha/beta hydrolase family protein [Hymenobacter sp. DG25A]|uniref:alpha/beta hydrolase family protein n=1 Tax=Hymenobacter sp. DG25A TaxID=1385663 RepID=UPI0006C89658|nr:hypothetical protein [Hymenobacter sp. DG25A]
MKLYYWLWLVLLPVGALGQQKTAADYGFRHLRTVFQGDTVDILIKSRAVEEQVPKPLFLFCQGSLPQPLLKLADDGHVYGVFPFKPDSLLRQYHLAIIGKPYVPLIGQKSKLGRNFTYVEPNGSFPAAYSRRNHLTYYVKRNIAVLRFLRRQPWVAKQRLVVAGHSEGSTVAAKMAQNFHPITHLIYSGGNPSGRILNIIAQDRAVETDSSRTGEASLADWQTVVNTPQDLNASQGDTHLATYSFSIPPQEYLQKLRIPTLISYGTKDWCAPYVDLLRVDFIRSHKTNATFLPYIGTEHNYFPVLPNGQPNYEVFNWDKVADDWLAWLSKK